MSFRTPTGAWGVLWLFAIPFGPGIPGGVIYARSHGIGWPVMEALYLVSDLLLACVFEPAMRLFIKASRSNPRLAAVSRAMGDATRKTTSLYGTAGGPFTLILIAFGVDPMTGRAAAAAAGHGVLSGWTLAITGDMLYFTVLMISTLWLNSILGNGTITTIAILGLMFGAPMLIQRWKERKARSWR